MSSWLFLQRYVIWKKTFLWAFFFPYEISQPFVKTAGESDETMEFVQKKNPGNLILSAELKGCGNRSSRILS